LHTKKKKKKEGLAGLEMVDPITPAQVKKHKVWEEMVTKVSPPLPPPPSHPPGAAHTQGRQTAGVCVHCMCHVVRLSFPVVLRLRGWALRRQFSMSADKGALFDGKAMTTPSGNVIAPNLGAGIVIG
jgi:hypothetical protein